MAERHQAQNFRGAIAQEWLDFSNLNCSAALDRWPRQDSRPNLAGSLALERIRSALGAHPHVAEVGLRWARDHNGRFLKAHIVPAADAPPEQDLRRTLEVWLRRHLPPGERPRALSFGPRLPAEGERTEDVA